MKKKWKKKRTNLLARGRLSEEAEEINHFSQAKKGLILQKFTTNYIFILKKKLCIKDT